MRREMGECRSLLLALVEQAQRLDRRMGDLERRMDEMRENMVSKAPCLGGEPEGRSLTLFTRVPSFEESKARALPLDLPPWCAAQISFLGVFISAPVIGMKNTPTSLREWILPSSSLV